MGKAEDVQHLQGTSLDAQGTSLGAGSSSGCCLGCSRVRKLVTLRCVIALVLGVAVLLSAVFWLPIFHFGDRKDLDLDYQGHDVVASFMVNKSASFLSDNMLQLQNDIFSEIPFSSTKVEIISLESAGPNKTKVVFAVESDVTAQSLIRESFVNLITNLSGLHLTAPSFGDPFSFDVIKFKGGITASPDHQKAFLMQSVKVPFNFTLNFSIDRLLNNFDELTSQLKTGLRLTPYENLFIGLTNLKGSTISPPTTVQSQVVLAVGINPLRVKQLAQTITGSHAKNLGLNNTVFGRVKQVRLSSILQHSLGNDGSPSPSPVPSQSPMSKPRHHHHHHHHHTSSPSPTVSPSPSSRSGGSSNGKGSPVSTPAPAPVPAKATEPPCPFGYNNRHHWKHSHPRIAPTPSSVYPPYIAPSRPRRTHNPAPKISPVTAERPSPNVAYAHSRAPSQGGYYARPPDVMSITSPSPSPSSARIISSSIWALLLFILLGMAL